MDSRDITHDLESTKINCTFWGLNCGPSRPQPSHYPDCWVREAETVGDGGSGNGRDTVAALT